MESLKIEILNPKAKQLLNNLVDLDLIRIKKEKDDYGFLELLSKLRKNSNDAPTLEEISEEVELVRKLRYES